MEKVTILVGMADRYIAATFFDAIECALKERKIDITMIDNDYLVIETKHTRTAFIYNISAQPLNGVQADALFGEEPYRQKLAPYLKKHKVYNNDVGLVDYIEKEETNGKIREASEAFDKCVKDHIDKAAIEAIKKANPESLYPKQIYISTAQTTGKDRLLKELEQQLWKNEFVSYCKNDTFYTHDLWRKMNTMNNPTKKPLPEIKNVIFNNPATIVFWADGTKTVVQAIDGDIYDPEKGLAMAMCKKMLGNKHEYYNTFKHWLKKCKDK